MIPNHTLRKRNNLYNKHLVYKLWVSDCETEKGDKKRAKMLHQPPLPVQLTIWIYFKFLSFKFTEVNLL